MSSKLLIAAVLAVATTFPALAADTGTWRASKLIGLNVYNEQNEKLGDISELLVDKTGKVDGVIIGVGGFLGVGKRDIKVSFEKLKFSDEPVRSASSSSSSSTTSRGTTTGSANTARSDEHKWYPDHAMLSGASKDQLKSMPEFKY
ncbi:MAG TPA: PRC-barrel domain-containing protein [Pseudolabrys sp.]|nr:PRC-barrel domain-containing protein [Pseudolabrys sp.]